MIGASYFGCLSGPQGFTCWISFAPVFSPIYCWFLIFDLSHFYILIFVFWEMMHWLVRGLSCKPNIFASWSTSELRVRLAPWNRFKPSSKIFLLTVPRRFFFVRVCLLMPCGHLLGKDWPLGSRLWCLIVSLSLSLWYPWSAVVLDWIDFWSLHPYLHWLLTLAAIIWWLRFNVKHVRKYFVAWLRTFSKRTLHN